VTPLELRHATVAYPDATIRAAVEAGLRECPFEDLPNEPGFAPRVVHWLTDSDPWEWFPPPLPENTIAAIHRHPVASANCQIHLTRSLVSDHIRT
jgi:hypothetical protein